MKKRVLAVCLAVFLLAAWSAAFAQEKVTQDDAKQMVVKAIAYLKENGKDKAFQEFNNPAGKFAKGELYIFAQQFDGVMLSHGANAKLIGQNHIQLKDANGKLFVNDMVAAAKAGSGWVDYSWTHPQTKKVQGKTAFIQRVEGADYYLGCGIYK